MGCNGSERSDSGESKDSPDYTFSSDGDYEGKGDEVEVDVFDSLALVPIGLESLSPRYVYPPYMYETEDGRLYIATIEFTSSWSDVTEVVEASRTDTGARISVDERALVFEHGSNWYSITLHGEDGDKVSLSIQFFTPSD